MCHDESRMTCNELIDEKREFVVCCGNVRWWSEREEEDCVYGSSGKEFGFGAERGFCLGKARQQRCLMSPN